MQASTIEDKVTELRKTSYGRQIELRKRIISTPCLELSSQERCLREIYDKSAFLAVYSYRSFVDEVPGGIAGKRIVVEQSIDELLERYQMDGLITEEQKWQAKKIQHSFDARYALDFLDCEIMRTRIWGSLYFKNELV